MAGEVHFVTIDTPQIKALGVVMEGGAACHRPAALRRGARAAAEPTSRSAGSVGSVGASRTPGRPVDGLDAAATARSFVAGGGGTACGRACDPAAVNEGETSRAGAAAGRAQATAHVTSVGAAQQGAAPRGARSGGGGRQLTRGAWSGVVAHGWWSV
jgi:hypothetical protein